MAMIWWICGPEMSVTGIFEDFAVCMIFLFGLYGTNGIAAAPPRSADLGRLLKRLFGKWLLAVGSLSRGFGLGGLPEVLHPL